MMARDVKHQQYTKKHLARLERERRLSRILIIGSFSVLVLVFSLIAYGIIQERIIKPNQPIAKVNDDVITTKEFQAVTRFSRQNLINQYQQTQQFMQLFGGGEENNNFFQQQLLQIAGQLQTEVMGQSVLDNLIEDRLIREEAKLRGISVTEEEIQRSIQTDFGYFPNGTPTVAPMNSTKPTSTLSPAQLTLVPPTPTITQVTLTETLFTATPSLAATVIITPTATVVPTLTPTPYTEELFSEDYRGYIDSINNIISVSEAQLRRIYESRMLREKISEEITDDVVREQDQVWARHILVSTEDEAKNVKARLDNGEDFASIAKELSTDTGSGALGGDLGWFGVGKMVPEFEKVAFNLNIGQISDPIQSQFGWHIIQVLGHELRELSESDYQTLISTTFSTWLDEQRQNANVNIYDYWLERVPTEPSIPTQ
jgi:parvulin-like peptidyl-prolyl isomerase